MNLVQRSQMMEWVKGIMEDLAVDFIQWAERG
jgi:hypothetical protein